MGGRNLRKSRAENGSEKSNLQYKLVLNNANTTPKSLFTIRVVKRELYCCCCLEHQPQVHLKMVFSRCSKSLWECPEKAEFVEEKTKKNEGVKPDVIASAFLLCIQVYRWGWNPDFWYWPRTTIAMWCTTSPGQWTEEIKEIALCSCMGLYWVGFFPSTAEINLHFSYQQDLSWL